MKKFYFITAVLLLFALAGKAQTATFPTGGTLTASNFFVLGTTYLHYDQHAQMLYPASVIPPQLKGAQITKITLDVTHYINPWGDPQVVIKLMNTTAPNLKTAFLDVTSVAPVYEGDFQIVPSGERGKIVLNFNKPTPFVYTGGNLLLDITSAGGIQTDIAVCFYGENSPVDSCCRRRGNSRVPAGEPPKEYLDKFLPKLNVEYIPAKVEKVVTMPCSNTSNNAVTLNGQAFEMTGNLGFKYKINSSAWQYVAAEKENMPDYTAMRYTLNTGLNVGATVTYYAWGKGTTDTLWGEPYSVTIQSGCIAPTLTDVTNITTTGGTVNWMTGSPSSDFNIRYKPLSATDWIYKNHVSNGVLTGLSPGTLYEVQVQTVCSSSSTSSWSVTKTFRTSCGALPVPYFEDFTTGLTLEELCYKSARMLAGAPEDIVGILEVDHVSKNVKILNNTEAGPMYVFYLMLPRFDVDVNLLRLRFRGYSENQFIKAEIGVTRIDDAKLFTHVEIMENPIGNTPELYSFHLSGYNLPLNGTERICIKFALVTGTSVRIEDIEVTMADESCLPPYGVTVSDVAENQATVDWLQEVSQTKWTVEYRSYTNDDWTNWQSVKTTTYPHTLTGLRKSTDYQVRVRTVCGENVSIPSNVVSFKTLCELGISKSGISSIYVYSYLNRVCIVNHDNLMIQKVEITDLYGRLVYRGMVNDNPEVINMNVPVGVYVVRVMKEDNILNYKLLITN